MTNLHPHWNSTAGGNEPGEFDAPRKVQIGRTISRKPAAIFGIALAVIAGVVFFHGMDVLTGQLQESNASSSQGSAISTSASATSAALEAVNLPLTEKSAPKPTKQPSTPIEPDITVKPGQTIQIINKMQIPQIVRAVDTVNPDSPTLLADEGGNPLYTPALFPNDTYDFTVSHSQKAGDYEYQSDTSDNVYGIIRVTDASGVASTAPSSKRSLLTGGDLRDSPFGSLDDIPLPTGGYGARADGPTFGDTVSVSSASSAGGLDDFSGKIAAAIGSSASTPEAPIVPMPEALSTVEENDAPDPVQDANIPVNPYAVGSTLNHPFDAAGNPIENLHGGAPLGGYRPPRQPETGPGIWIVYALSIGSILWVTRKSLKAFA